MYLVIVRAEIQADVNELLKRIRNGQWTPITEQPIFSFPEAEGFTSDAPIRVLQHQASGQVLEAEGGWGLHLFGNMARASWTRETIHLVARKRLSISPLELLTISAEFLLLGTTRMIPDNLEVEMRCD